MRQPCVNEPVGHVRRDPTMALVHGQLKQRPMIGGQGGGIGGGWVLQRKCPLRHVQIVPLLLRSGTRDLTDDRRPSVVLISDVCPRALRAAPFICFAVTIVYDGFVEKHQHTNTAALNDTKFNHRNNVRKSCGDRLPLPTKATYHRR